MKNSRLIEVNIEDINWKNLVSDNSNCELNNYIKNIKNMKIEPYEDYDNDGNLIKSNESWKNISLNVNNIKNISFSNAPALSFYDISDIVKINNAFEAYLLEYNDLIYYSYKYQKINGFHPGVFRFEEFNCAMFIKRLFKYYKIPLNSYNKVSYQSKSEYKISSMLIAFSRDMYLYLDGNTSGVLYYNPVYEQNKNSVLYTVLGLLKNTKERKVVKNKIYIVYRNSHGFEKKGFNVAKRNISISENYNDDFPEMSEKIINGLNDKHKTNLVILSGDPGTGKTTYVRYLATKLKKNVIFISPDMVDSITDPAFIPFLMENNDSILVIEDAEPALEKRNAGGRSSAVSNVLNLTDGLLSDCLKISIVATFNTDQKNIDSALTRKGRLLMNYKFDKLSVEKSQQLLAKLGHNVKINQPMTLADIYFYGNDNNNEGFKIKKIGF